MAIRTEVSQTQRKTPPEKLGHQPEAERMKRNGPDSRPPTDRSPKAKTAIVKLIEHLLCALQSKSRF